MLKIVQFTHPGSEHSHDKSNPKLKSWNDSNHKRKFMLCDGEYVENEEIKKGEIMFWGEWEAPSIVSKFENKPDKFYPKFFHKPFLPNDLSNYSNSNNQFQNTDPCVFDNSFKYFICKQFKNNKETQLSKLDKGSIILFGSTANQNSENAYFQLDTVFVVSDFLEYDLNNINSFNIPPEKENLLIDTEMYLKYSMKMVKNGDKSLKLRLYFGATFENKINGMYSFSPSKIWNNDVCGFKRVCIKDINKYITNNLNASPKISVVNSIDESYEFWNQIKNNSREQGCVEGVKFNYNKEI